MNKTRILEALRSGCELHAACVLHFDLGGGSSAPAPDPNIGIAAANNSAISKEALDFNKQIYEENKPRQARSDAIAERVVNDQLDISKQNQAQAADQWSRFKTLFAPVEEQTIRDATTIDSAAEMERAAGDAASGVQTQFDNAAGQRRRYQLAMGVNPNSGRAMALDSEGQLGLAAAKAGAATNARLLARDRGIALRAGVANFGRNMPNTAANAYGIATAGGSNAVGNQNSTLATANANAAQMNQGFGTAINGYNSAGSILNQQYGNQLNAWNAQNQADALGSAGLGGLIGQVGMMSSKPWWAGSSKKIKTNKQPVEDAEILDEVKNLPVEEWDYKAGEGDGGRHIGSYAEDVQRKFGNEAAPGGKMVDLISMNGIALSSVKGLSRQVDRLEAKVQKLSAARGK